MATSKLRHIAISVPDKEKTARFYEAAVQHYLTFPNKGKAQLASAGFLTTPPATTDDTALILLKDNLVPLYLEFIAEYYGKLLALGEKELADRLSAWRDELCSVPEK